MCPIGAAGPRSLGKRSNEPGERPSRLATKNWKSGPVAYPLALTLLRLMLGPVLVWLAWHDRQGRSVPWLLAGMYAGLASDFLDGVLARHLGVATPRLRRFDSQTDLVFWLCVLACVWQIRPVLASRYAGLVGAMLTLELITYTTSFIKFGREHCTHAYSAKAWAVVQVITLTAVVGWGAGRVALPARFAAYLVSWADVMAIILILPRWQCDVPSCYHAWLVRRGIAFRKHKLFH